MGKRLSSLAYPLVVVILLAGIIGVAGFLASVALPDMLHTGSVASASPSAKPAASANPQPTSAMGLSPIGIAMPPNANCSACHTTASGGVGVKQIPFLGHPLKGFASCTACHNPAGLVKTAEGHSSLHANECLVCHQENPKIADMTAAPMRPEHMGGAACTTCHGVDKHAPLPSDMAGRGDNCWICHNGPEFQYLFESSSPGASRAPTPAPSVSPSPSAPSGYYLQQP